MNLFIDTEFNSFKGALISMALVDETGRNFFYESLGCENPDPWVAENVMPRLWRGSVSREVMQARLARYLAQFDSIHVIADWPEDIQHFCEILITGPGERFNTPPLTMEIRRDLDAVSNFPHNALYDALAIRTRYLELTQ